MTTIIAAGHMLHHRAALTGADFQHQNQQPEPNVGTGKGGTATAGGHQAEGAERHHGHRLTANGPRSGGVQSLRGNAVCAGCSIHTKDSYASSPRRLAQSQLPISI